MITVKVKKSHQNAIIPKYATGGAACFDLHAAHEGELGACGGSMGFDTGLSFEVPEGFVMLVYSRSGHGFNNGVRLVNSVGVIDSDYRGVVAVKLRNDSALRFDVKAGDRIAQAMIIPVPTIELVEVTELTTTERGESGFGSTGVSA